MSSILGTAASTLQVKGFKAGDLVGVGVGVGVSLILALTASLVLVRKEKHRSKELLRLLETTPNNIHKGHDEDVVYTPRAVQSGPGPVEAPNFERPVELDSLELIQPHQY